MNRDGSRDRSEILLGEGLEVTAFPRRKKRRGRGWIGVLILLLGACAAFVVYCIQLPEEQPFANVASTPGATYAAGELSSALPDERVGALAQAMKQSRASGEAGNPLQNELRRLDLAWRASVANVNAQSAQKGADELLLTLDVAHADIWQYVDELAKLGENDGIFIDPSGAIDGSVEPVPDTAGIYAFALNSGTGENEVRLRGKIDAERGALTYVVKNSQDKTTRFLECVRSGSDYYIQLLSGDGPYKGVLFICLRGDTSMRCAYMDSKNFEAPKSIFKTPPSSWESFTEKAKQVFSQDAPRGGVEKEESASYAMDDAND